MLRTDPNATTLRLRGKDGTDRLVAFSKLGAVIAARLGSANGYAAIFDDAHCATWKASAVPPLGIASTADQRGQASDALGAWRRVGGCALLVLYVAIAFLAGVFIGASLSTARSSSAAARVGSNSSMATGLRFAASVVNSSADGECG